MERFPNRLLWSVFRLINVVALAGCSDEAPVSGTSVDSINSGPPAAPDDAMPDEGSPPQQDSGYQQTAQQERPDPLQSPPATAERQFRLPDNRTEVNKLRLRESGIHVYSGHRLLLLSDLPDARVAHLPKLADQLFRDLELFFGKLPPAADGSEFQVTGHVISEEPRFRAIGLMPPAAFTFEHGRHLNYEFWMYDQEDDYYLRHLLLHEFTHCFMTCHDMQDIPPLWYIEGMAEYFATHDRTSAAFGILPPGHDGFDGWGRITRIRQQFDSEAQHDLRGIPLTKATPETVATFRSDAQYATSWAVCWFLWNHPEYRKQFEPLTSLRRRQEFNNRYASLCKPMESRIRTDWLLFQETLEEGFDSARSWPVHAEAHSQRRCAVTIRADRDWQDTGVRISAGDTVGVECSGRFAVHNKPRHWISEPQGVSIEYYRGLPLGQITAVLVAADGSGISPRFAIGRSGRVTASVDSSLWLQANDSCARRAGNSGTAEAIITIPNEETN